ncbi:alpha/beta fold hydrolase [Nonomuraea spiralis]|uniref:alpha/beta fold hydrolase n=1 Tax=Nonomuraea TaxID=83681 RepID=UPI000F76DD9D|nr:alpha/beta hydrolase [Nonomuraea sp. WAC 01424]RSN10317.1 alpha/beta hydrolase [Nonomuraea sp. WAC 01424]
MLTVTSADGTEVRAIDEGRGPAIVVLHAGLDDGTQWGRVARLLAPRFRVVRVRRRQYRQDLVPPATMAQEAADVAAVAAVLGGPALLVGHSSGGVAALESLLAAPDAFAGAVLYEPPVPLGPSLGGAASAVVEAALADGRPGRAMRVLFRDVVGLSPPVALLAALAVACHRPSRALVPHQVDDLLAIDALGDRMAAYAGIRVPVVLLGGERSPAHLGARLDALREAIPGARRVTLRREGHGAHLRASRAVADVIEAHADAVLGRQRS